ncbi:MAG: HAD family phosphatase, partial [Candidatus Chisholmbacteria bacterium]|nr:HAD family phosphatase [Candidatus Chisholmbacteria bacterium]
MRYKALLLDIDGTVVGEDYRISPRVKEAIGKAKEKLLVSLCSQRQYVGFEHYVKELDLTALQIASGGTQIVDDKTGKEVRGKRMNKQVAKRLYNGLIKRGEVVFINDDKFVYQDGRIEEYKGYPVPIKPVNQLKDWGSVLGIGVDGISKESWRWVESLEGVQGVRVFSDKSQGLNNGYASISAKGVSKQRGIMEYCRINKIKPEEVIAVGDDLNDY